MRFLRTYFVLLCFAIFLFQSMGGTSADCQIAADLRGRVLDPTGAVVANAHVELTNSSTNVHQTTDSSSTGDYLFTHLSPGAYSVRVTASGFKTLDHSGITVVVGQTVNADLMLSPGGDRQTVEVNSDVPVMQVGTSDIQTNIS